MSVGDNTTKSIFAGIRINFPPDSKRLPVELSQPDFFFAIFDVLVNWIAYFIATLSVVVSLMICMAVVLFLCVYLLELITRCIEEILSLMKVRRQPAIF
jgi:hypothetical protein